MVPDNICCSTEHVTVMWGEWFEFEAMVPGRVSF